MATPSFCSRKNTAILSIHNESHTTKLNPNIGEQLVRFELMCASHISSNREIEVNCPFFLDIREKDFTFITNFFFILDKKKP